MHYAYVDITGARPAVNFNSQEKTVSTYEYKSKQKPLPFVARHRRTGDKEHFTTADDGLTFCQTHRGYELRGWGMQLWPPTKGSPGKQHRQQLIADPKEFAPTAKEQAS